jgi:hypothetical protein
MVSHTRTTARPDQLRSLNQPRPLHIQVEQGRPVAVIDNSKRHQISSIQDTWIIEDEWWRQPISRQYFSVLLSNGQSRTIYHDRIANTWFAQAY